MEAEQQLTDKEWEYYVKNFNINTNIYKQSDFVIKDSENCHTLYNLKDDWHSVLHIHQIEIPPLDPLNLKLFQQVSSFIGELEELCYKYNLSIGHEDHQGGFIIYEGRVKENIEWLSNASWQPKGEENGII